jgi:AmiR/NasT family two-component response regulator
MSVSISKDGWMHRLSHYTDLLPAFIGTAVHFHDRDSSTVRSAALQSSCLAYLTRPFSARSLIEPLEKAAVA